MCILDKLVSISTAAEALGVSTSTLRAGRRVADCPRQELKAARAAMTDFWTPYRPVQCVTSL